MTLSRDEWKDIINCSGQRKEDFFLRTEYDYAMRYLIDLFDLVDPSKWYVPRVSTKLHYRKNDNKETTTPIRSIARRKRLLRGLNSSSGIASGS